MTSNHFTPTELAILRVLSDGQPHKPQELHRCLPDEMSQVKAVRYHLSNIRKKIRPEEDIIPEWHKRAIHYRHVKTISSET